MLTLKQIAEIVHKINPVITNVVLQQKIWNGDLCINYYKGPVQYDSSLLDFNEEGKLPFYHLGWREENIADYIGCWEMVKDYVDLSEYPKNEDGVYDLSSAIVTFNPEEPTLTTLEEIADYVAPLFSKARYYYYNKHQYGGVFLLITSEKMEYDSSELIKGMSFGWHGSGRHTVASILIEDQKNLEPYEGDYSKAEVSRDNNERSAEELLENHIIDISSKLFVNAVSDGDYFIRTSKKDK